MNTFITRRSLLEGMFGTIVVGTAIPIAVPKASKLVKVVCVTFWQGRQWVVFDDKPQTIFAFQPDDHFQPFKPGEQYLIEANG